MLFCRKEENKLEENAQNLCGLKVTRVGIDHRSPPQTTESPSTHWALSIFNLSAGRLIV